MRLFDIEKLKPVIEKVRANRKWLLTLSVLVVFITTYMLILPAFTLEKDEAEEQGGIDLPVAEETVAEEPAPAEEPKAVEEEPAETVQEEAEEAEPEAEEPAEQAEESATEVEEELQDAEEQPVAASDDKEGAIEESAEDAKASGEVTEEKATEKAEEKEVAEDTDPLTYEGENYRVIVEDKGHVLPANTEIKVKEIDEQLDKKEYKKYVSDSIQAVNDDEETNSITELKFARFYDITLVADGKEINAPKDAVSVRIEYDKELSKSMNVEDPESLRVIHFAEDKKTGVVEPEILDSKNVEVNTDKKDLLTDATFEAESFSVYAVVYTVDFSYSVDGKSFEYSIEGDSSISLKTLLETLEVIKDDKDTEPNELDLFMGEVDKVEFTNNELIKIEKAEGDEADWTLMSLKPFDTEEKLTITMKNGDVFVIDVTDSNFASTVDGKTFALIIANSANTNGYALDSGLRNDNRFVSRQTTINYLGETVNEEVYFCENVDSIKWTFEYIKGSGNQFELKASNGQYLHYEEGQGFSLSNEPTVLYADVTPGDNDHVRLCIDEDLHNAINLYNGNNGFGIYGSGNNDPNEKFTLCTPFDMSSNTPGTINTVDNTVEGIELKLFDYDYITTPGTTGTLDKDGNKINSDKLNSTYNTSVNEGKKFWFLGWGSDSNVNDPGINDFTGLGDNIRALQGIVQNNLVDGYPVLAVDQNGNATNESLAYLFDGTANDTKTYPANHLFEKIGDKYSYDSNKHYAEFNTSTKNFTVYDGTLEQNSGSDKWWAKNDKAVGFFPFDSYSDMKGLYDSNRLYLNPDVSEYDQRKSNGEHYRMNHHNGMSLDAHFRLPEGGQDSYGNDIEFEFSGDDDLWVYIDDVLVLDIGGVHQPLNGKINFTTGEVTVDAAVTADGADGTKVAGASTTIEEMFEKAGKTYDPNKLHEMKVFWIERGGCDSNCKIEFNLPLTTTKEAGAITFDKVSAKDTSLKLQGAVFTLYKDAACTQPLTIGNVPVTATSDEDGVVNFYAIPVGSYYIKETTFPEGYQAKDPEEIFTVTVAKDVTVKPVKDDQPIDPVTNEPKKINVEVEKIWENDIIPKNASIEFVLGRYKLVEDPNAQGKGTIVIKDSYTGLPEGKNYKVTYTITGPDNYSKTITKTYSSTDENIEISVPKIPAGLEYTVKKQVARISGCTVNNDTETQTVTVTKNESVDAQFTQSTISGSYRVRVYAVEEQDWNNTYKYSENYYPAGSSLSVNIQNDKSGTWDSEHCTFTCYYNSENGPNHSFTSNGSWNFTNSLSENVDLYVYCNTNSGWNHGWDQIKTPTITGASPVRTNSLNSNKLMMASKGGMTQAKSQTATAPTLPDPPVDTVYELDTEYAQNPDKITLSGNPWKDTITGLDANNEYGPYVYYIASVNESGMPEGTQMTISDEVSMDGSAKVLTVTNNVPLGDLKITKTVQKNNNASTGTFYYAVYDEEYDASASPAQTPVKTGSLEVTENGTKTEIVTGLLYGTYYVYELTGEGGTPIISGADGTYKTLGDTVYKVTGSGSSADVGESAGEVTLTNKEETVSKTATKTWSDNVTHPTIYFKLFYEVNNGIGEDGFPIIEDIEVTDAEVKELASGTTSVTWDNLPKYDGNGNEYEYLVKEYVKNDNNELVAAAPDGYVKTELGLSVTNTKSEGYDPRTTYSGTKIWVDTANNGATRPESIQVTLLANNEPTGYTAQWTKGTGDKANEWTYTFSDLPVFDENGNYITYKAVEGNIDGYEADDPVVTETKYQQLESQEPARVTTNSNLDITLAEETDLAYIVIKKNANRHLIWTQRAITAAEKQKLYNDINNLEGFIGELEDSTVEFVSGLPIEKVFEKGTVTVTKTNNTTMHVAFVKQNQWAQLCYGSYKYEYSPGTTTFTNRIKTISVDASKVWQDASGKTLTPAPGTTVTFDLFIGNEAQNKQIELNGETDTDTAQSHAYESEPWKAYWDDLAEYDSEGNKITYTVKEVTGAEGFTNQNPDGVAAGGTITNKQIETEINILKVKKGTSTPLTGAKFILEKYDESRRQVLKTWEEAEVSSEEGKEGNLTFEGLSVGYYKLTETKSPEGYVKTSDAPEFEVTIDENGNLNVVFENTSMVTYEDGVFKVQNEPGASLPNSGGIGTTIFYALGSILVLVCGVYFIARRRVVN